MPKDDSWSALAELDEVQAQAAMTQRFQQVAGMDLEARLAKLRDMIEAEYELGDSQLLRFTGCRLRSWLELPDDQANTIAKGYNTVFEKMSGNLAMRRAGAVQTVAREMTPDEVASLHKLIPSLVSQIPTAKRIGEPQPAAAREPEKKKKRFWGRS